MSLLHVEHFFDRRTSTLTYVVYDNESKDAVIIDPVWDFDPASGHLRSDSVDHITQFANRQGLKIHYVLETHAHADHISGAQLIKQAFPQCKVLIGDQICTTQRTFKAIYNLPDSFVTDGSQFDGLLKDQSIVRAGKFEFKVLATPGHTPACVSYLFKGMIFTGDTLFMPDSGTGRCDFPDGSAERLYSSVTQKIYTLPDETKTYTAHDYQPGGRELLFQSTVKEQKEKNIHINMNTSEEEFVSFRTQRDKSLNAPQLLLPSLQINIRGGRLPEAESNGIHYLKIPTQILESP